MMKRTIPIGSRVPRRRRFIAALLARLLLHVTRWRITGEFPDVPRAVVIGAPHTSNWDGFFGVLAIMALRLRLNFLAKHTLFHGPAGMLMRWVGAVPVDRAGANGVAEESVHRLRHNRSMLLGITPEGTRRGAESWKTGFYRIARDAAVPIVVVVFDYGRRRIHVADTVYPGNDEASDMARILDNYRGAVARHPQYLSTPLRALADEAKTPTP